MYISSLVPGSLCFAICDDGHDHRCLHKLVHVKLTIILGILFCQFEAISWKLYYHFNSFYLGSGFEVAQHICSGHLSPTHCCLWRSGIYITL